LMVASLVHKRDCTINKTKTASGHESRVEKSSQKTDRVSAERRGGFGSLPQNSMFCSKKKGKG